MQAVRGIAPASPARIVRSSFLSEQQFPTPLPRATPKDCDGFGAGSCPGFLTNDGRSPSNYLSLPKRPFSPQFFNLPQTAASLRQSPSGYFVWQNGRFHPNRPPVPTTPTNRPGFSSPNATPFPKTWPLNLSQLRQMAGNDQNIGQGQS